MTAARARGRRGQGTLEFILVLPLLIIMLVAVADYASVCIHVLGYRVRNAAD